MINTHYFLRPPELDAEPFALFLIDVKNIVSVAKRGIPICGRDGSGAPDLTAERIAFNGCLGDGGDHEPLVIERVFTDRRNLRGECFGFCKTHGKPYDLAVVATLYALLHRFPASRFTTDSNFDELQAGFELFKLAAEPKGVVSALFERPVKEKA